jgi:hypothetical protein
MGSPSRGLVVERSLWRYGGDDDDIVTLPDPTLLLRGPHILPEFHEPLCPGFVVPDTSKKCIRIIGDRPELGN